MKALRTLIPICLGLAGGWPAIAADPATAPAAALATAPAPATTTTTTTITTADPAPPDNAPPAAAASAPATADAAPPPDPGATPQLRLNFRGVPLDMVLNYLSDAAGFIINLETEVRGRVDVWSNQPLSQEEAIDLLNTVLNKNGYAAIRNGRTLTVVSRDEAKKRDVPVKSGNNPEAIPKSDEIVTQILPVRYISATQLIRDLQPLLPTSAQMTANEGGNSLVITDSQVNIRRMAEIVQALDTAIASVSSVRVFVLQYADAKALATVVKELFVSQDLSRSQGNQGGAGRFFNAFRGGGGPPGMPGGDGGGGGSGSSPGGGRAPTPGVVAVADERSNALVVRAPEEQMTVIASVVEQVDKNVEDVTELRVFRLQYADPQETADLLTDLFDDTASSSRQRQGGGGQLRFGGAFGGGPGGIRGGAFGSARSGAADQSARMQAQTRVVAVPDLRTGSVVVSAARDLMEEIARMLDQLDADPARKQKVFVYSVENSDPQAVQEVIQSLFPEQNTGANRTTRSNQRQNNNQLNNRQTQTRNQGSRSTGSGFGNSGGGGFGGN